MAFLSEYGLFLLEALTIAAVVALLVKAMRGASQGPPKRTGELRIQRLDRHFEALGRAITAVPYDRKRARKARKARIREAKARDKAQRRRIFVLDFKGDLRASAAASLREEISAILAARREGDEVLLRLESPGGLITGYGLAASQLTRLKTAQVPLTVVVDQVAASGGYMMACVADSLVAAPFAVVGSIGVVTTVPNVNRLLKRHDVDVEMLTAGEYKRTLTMLGENTAAGRAKVQAQLDEMHGLFKAFIHEHRPDLDVEMVATGEYWQGVRAKELGLVDEIATSDDWLLARREEADLLALCWQPPNTVSGWVRRFLGATLRDTLDATRQAEVEARIP